MKVVKNNPKKEQSDNIKRVSRKHVVVQESNLLEKVLVSKYKKWQRLIAKWIGVELADAYEYMFKIKYKSNSTRLRVDDIVFNSEQVLFVVVQESNRMALIVTHSAFVTKPKVWGSLYVLEKTKDKK